MEYPKDFLQNMSTLLGPEYDDFMHSIKSDSYKGLRINTLKIDNHSCLSCFNLTPIDWCNTGFYYTNSTPGKHPYHNAGLYYIQEPSAMAVVELANVQPNDFVLDLCASPGGKSTQIACKLHNTGLLVANEIISSRAKILSENIERCGVAQAIVTNETPAKLANTWGAIFDKVFVDAPCSGEGMFRKDDTAIKEWTPQLNEACHIRQLEILNSADALVKGGGKLIYSTCTFSPTENEKTIDDFIKTHPHYTIDKLNHNFDSGKYKYIASDNKDLNNCVRIFPHHTKGEGHFVAVLTKTTETTDKPIYYTQRPNKKNIEIFKKWQNDNLNTQLSDNIVQFGDNMYIQPKHNLDINKIKIERYGLHLGEINKGIFTPSHSLAIALKTLNFKRIVNVNYDDSIKYLRGNTLNTDVSNGWCAVALDGHILGLGKIVNGIVKNHYPKGLRI